MKKLLFILPLALFANWHTFPHKLFNALEQETRFVSPFSVQSALMMTYLGARGDTKSEMGKLIAEGERIVPPYIPSSSVRIANSIWVDDEYHLLTEYRNRVKDLFSASIHSVSFKDREETGRKINSWVAEAHEGKIGPLVGNKTLDENTRMALFNTIYFKDTWLHPFDNRQTKLTTFFGDTEERPVQMMHQTSILPYFETRAMKAMLLPFAEDQRHAAVVVLPKEGHHLEMENLPLDRWRHKLVDFYLPRFKVEQKCDLIPTLRRLGIRKALSNDADFSGLTGYPSLKIDKVFTSTMMEVNEKGVCASGATTVIMGLKSANMRADAEFVANRPFGIMIIDVKTKLILFMGEVCLP